MKYAESFEQIDGYEDVVVEKGYLHPDSHWNHVEVYLEFERVIERGSDIKIKITTVCVSDSVLEWRTSSSYLNHKVLVDKLNMSDEIYMVFPRAINADFVRDSMQPDEIFEREYTLGTKNYYAKKECFRDDVSVGFVDVRHNDYAPVGVYDLHLDNGYIYRNAFIIVESL